MHGLANYLCEVNFEALANKINLILILNYVNSKLPRLANKLAVLDVHNYLSRPSRYVISDEWKCRSRNKSEKGTPVNCIV